MQTMEPFYLYTLRQSLLSRQRRNPAYSLRAFAKDLQIDSSNLSAILQNKRRLPPKRAGFISRKLQLNPKESALFIASTVRKQMTLDAIEVAASAKKYLLDEKFHRVISEWEYYALLQLLNTRGFKSDISWISARLGITDSRTRLVIQNLIELGFIKEDRKKGYLRTVPALATSEDVVSQALQDSHHESLEIAKNKLKTIPIDQRDFSSITMAISTDKIPQAKAIIREFQEKLHSLLTTGAKDQVYQFSCQLFPLTQGEKP